MNWEPWTGCYKVSDGCTYCYFYGPYSKRHGQSTVQKTGEFDKPVDKTAKGAPRIGNGKTVITCFASDFLILTKRIDRFMVSLPSDWDGGVDHVTVGGETGQEARVCDYDWVSRIRGQCVSAGITFWFKNTGSFFRQDGAVRKVNPFKQN